MNLLEIVTSMSAMTDKTKPYVMNGTIWKYESRYDVLVPTNEIPKSINADGTPYNSGRGWETGYYIDAGTGEKRSTSNTSYYEVTGFIPVKADDIFRIAGYTFDASGTVYDNITFYDSSFALVGAFTAVSNYNPLSQFIKDDDSMEICVSTAATTNFTQDTKNRIAYMRLSFSTISNSTTCIINLFEEKVELKPAGWYDTKMPYYGDDIKTQGETINQHTGIIGKIQRYMGLHK